MEERIQQSAEARERGDYEASYELLQQITEPDADRHALWTELSVTCYYVDQLDQGLNAINHLLLHPDGTNKDLTRANAAFYYKPLAHYMPSLTMHTFATPAGEKRPTNPSIIHVHTGTFQGYLATVRTVNYVRNPVTHKFTVDGVKQPLLSKTFLQLLDRNFGLVGQVEIKGRRLVSTQANCRGIEDARLFFHNDQLWIACTFPDSNMRKITRTGLACLGSTLDVVTKLALKESKTLVADKCYTLEAINEKRHEKNWIPFIIRGAIENLYSYGPHVFLRPDLSQCDFEREKETPCIETERIHPKFDLGSFRGSSCPLPWGDGFLLVVHERDVQFRYTHRFVVMDATRQVVCVSVPFYFTLLDIEYCVGLAYSCSGHEVLVSFGVNDCEAKMVSISISDVKSFLWNHSVTQV